MRLWLRTHFWIEKVGEGPVSLRIRIWNLSISHYRVVCDHTPKDLRGWKTRIVKINMKVNGPTCTTKRWWWYFEKHSFVIDWN